MSQENVEIVRRIWAAWEAEDWNPTAGFDTLVFDSELEFEFTAEPGLGSYRGLEAARQGWRDYCAIWETFRAEASSFIDAGDHVVVLMRVYGRGEHSGVEVEMPGAQLITFRAGRIVRIALIPDQDEALEAAGLSE